jgi:hypothetical protein
VFKGYGFVVSIAWSFITKYLRATFSTVKWNIVYKLPRYRIRKNSQSYCLSLQKKIATSNMWGSGADTYDTRIFDVRT